MLQRQMLFPRGVIPEPPEHPTVQLTERVWFRTDAGRVEGWFMAPPDIPPGRRVPAVVFAHGNAELIDTWPEEFRRYNRMGIALLLVEYPGYGRSEGSPSQKRITQTLTVAYDWLVNRPEVDAGRIVLHGRSLGGGAVCRLAEKRPSAAMILQSTFTSARSFAIHYGVPGFLVLDPFDNLSVIRDYPHPVLIFHGERDEVIPVRHGRKLAAEAPNAELILYACGHNDCPPNLTAFWRDIEHFLKQAGILPEPADGPL